MNLANKLTVSRLFILPIILVLLYVEDFYAKFFAFILFIIAIITDVLDGKVAERRNMKTKFGNYMDPVIDKILVGALLISFTDLGLVPAWMTIIIISREFIISGIRSSAAAEGKVIGSNIWGKSKAGIQMIAITITLFLIAFEYLTRTLYTELNSWFVAWMNPIIYWSMFLATIVTIISIIVVVLLYYRKM